MRKSITLPDGIKLVTASTRRYVLFRYHEKFGYDIVKRSDNVSTLINVRRAHDVIVDFNHSDGPRVVA